MSHLVIVGPKQVRRVWHAVAWRFAVVDVVEALTDSANPAGYLWNIRRRHPPLSELFKGGGQFDPPLQAASGQF